MSAISWSEPILYDILDAIKPTKKDDRYREQIIKEFQSVVNTVEILEGATVEPYGSFVSRLHDQWGSLDISVMLPLPKDSHNSLTVRERKKEILATLFRVLLSRGRCHQLEFIFSAAIPILKFECGRPPVSCVVSVNNLCGKMNSRILDLINLIDGRFRNMVLLVKRWATTHMINNSKKRTLNSYSLCLLVIFHFQTCDPPLLPPLIDIYSRNVTDVLSVETIEDTIRRNISDYKASFNGFINKNSLSKLFASFLYKFSNIDTAARRFAICPFSGNWEDIHCSTTRLSPDFALYIEDPFSLPNNTATSVRDETLAKIAETFRLSFEKFTRISNPRAFIKLIVGPDIEPMISNQYNVERQHLSFSSQFLPESGSREPSRLDFILKDILDAIKPKMHDIERRVRVIEALQEVVDSTDSFGDITVEPYGSFLSQMFDRWGDLDMTLITSSDCDTPYSDKIEKQGILIELGKALRRRDEFRQVHCIINARVPILKFEYGDHSIACDVSVDNLPGQMKSKILYWINLIDGRFRDIVLLVKQLAQTHNINDPKTGTLNSYSLCMLVIFLFQTCEPELLPPLQCIYPEDVSEDLTGDRFSAEQRIEKRIRKNIVRYKENRTTERLSTSELFKLFLYKFSDINKMATRYGICTFTAEWEEICDSHGALYIEDPFEQSENTARAVTGEGLARVAQVFRASYQRVTSPTNPTKLKTLLAGPIFADEPY